MVHKKEAHMPNINEEGRRRSLSINVVQEARKLYGRGDLPWTDDDARRGDMIFKILQLDRSPGDESDLGKVVAKTQPETSKALVNVEKLLADIAVEDAKKGPGV
jgi:hypothetical protein